MRVFLTAFLAVFIIGMGFTLGTIYQKGQSKKDGPKAPVADLMQCTKIGEDALATLNLCIDRQTTFIQIIDDQSEIINSMTNILWDLPISDIVELRKEPKPRKLTKFSELAAPSFDRPVPAPMEPMKVPDTVDDVLKRSKEDYIEKSKVLPWSIEGTTSHTGPLY